MTKDAGSTSLRMLSHLELVLLDQNVTTQQFLILVQFLEVLYLPSSKTSMMDFSAILNLSLQLGLANNWSWRRKTASPCISQEKSTFALEKKQVGHSRLRKAMSVAKDETVISQSHISQQESLPPLVSALKTSAEKNAATFYFPGHNRGRAAPSSMTKLLGFRPFFQDVGALPELDNLFSPQGPILEAQMLAAKLFGSSETWFLVGGTTCGVQAAIMATCSPGQHVILPRNCHISAVSAMILSGAVPKYIVPEYDCDWDIAGGVTPFQVGKAFKELELEGQKAAAVFITSPTYHGICSNLRDISELCHSFGIPMIVDEAHGAHLGFHPQMPCSALQQGADLAIQSTHKVLSSLTQSSMLHMSGDIVDRERISRCLQTLQSTSPSYLLLASLDAARAQLGENPENVFDKPLELAMEAKSLIKKIAGITYLDSTSFSKFPAMDPLRLTVGFQPLGLSGYEADDILNKDHVVIPELIGAQSITFAINLGTCRDHILRLVAGLKDISARFQPIQETGKSVNHRIRAPFDDFCICLSPRDAFFANKRRVDFRESLGKVSGELICPYPPGIPVMIPGEIITEKALDYLLDAMRKGVVSIGASDPQLSSIVICDV